MQWFYPMCVISRFLFFRKGGASKAYGMYFLLCLINCQENKMKLKSTLLATAMVVFATSTDAVFAADDTAPVKTEAAKTGEAATPVKKPVKRHSHLEEKTGMPAPEPASGKSHRESMPKDMPMHDHTQDRH
jgi:hypothetical protein